MHLVRERKFNTCNKLACTPTMGGGGSEGTEGIIISQYTNCCCVHHHYVTCTTYITYCSLTYRCKFAGRARAGSAQLLRSRTGLGPQIIFAGLGLNVRLVQGPTPHHWTSHEPQLLRAFTISQSILGRSNSLVTPHKYPIFFFHLNKVC